MNNERIADDMSQNNPEIKGRGQMLESMKDAALAAGEFMKSSDERDHTDKSNRKDFVTVSDIKAQNILKEELTKNFPDVVILSEEDSEKDRQRLFDANFTGFVLDPIDGTYNFKRDMKESAISIGYIENGESVAGVIYDPYRGEIYEASEGNGAFRNGEPIHVSDHSDIEGSNVATSNSYDDEGMKRNLERHLAIYENTGHMPWTSCPGSGVLIHAWVACGRVDAYHHNGLKPWDNAAAFVIVKEAGGLIETLDGNEAKFTDSSVLIGNKPIVDGLRGVFSKLPDALLR